jgi:hypothetical protein
MKQSHITIILMTILMIGVIFYGTGLFSIIGEITSKPSCSLDTSNTCSIELSLPEYRELDSYTLDLSFKSVPGDFGSSVQVSAFSFVGPIESKYGTDYYTDYFYVYRLPEQWIVDDVYAVKFDASSGGWVSKSRLSASINLDFKFGMIKIPYSSNTILQCGEICDTKTNIIRIYKSSNEQRLNIYNTFLMGKVVESLNTESAEYDDVGLGKKLYGTSRREGVFVLEDMMKVYNINDVSEFVLYSNMEIEQEGGKSYSSYSTTLPPTIMLSYAPKLRPTDVQIWIGDERIDVVSGQPDSTTTKDLSMDINKYCERSSTTKKCIVPLTFKSSEKGIITIEKENVKILAQKEEPKGFSWSFIKNSFDFNNHPIQSYTTSGILLLLLILGIFMIPGGKKR